MDLQNIAENDLKPSGRRQKVGHAAQTLPKTNTFRSCMLAVNRQTDCSRALCNGRRESLTNAVAFAFALTPSHHIQDDFQGLPEVLYGRTLSYADEQSKYRHRLPPTCGLQHEGGLAAEAGIWDVESQACRQINSAGIPVSPTGAFGAEGDRCHQFLQRHRGCFGKILHRLGGQR